MKLLRPLRWLLIALAITLIPAAAARAEVVISVGFAPPPLLVYDQPPCPDQGMIWTPGYWGYGPDGYFWVPGGWVPAPYEDALWTPGYWGWSDNMYYWHPGYWGREVGYYGGINYGFGYFGIGFLGGRWNGGLFEYNTAVWHVNTTVIHRTYVDRDWNRHYVDRNSHVAFNGGRGGIRHDPTPRERTYMREPHTARTTFQTQHIQAARNDHSAYYNVNHGRPQNVVSWRPLGQENHPVPAQRNGFNNNSRDNVNNGARNGYQPNRGGQNPPAENNRDNRQPRQQQPQYRTQPGYTPVPPQVRQQPQSRPQPPESRPQQQPQYRTQPESRPQPQSRPQQENRAQPQQRPENHGNRGEQPRQQHDDHGKQ